MRRFAAVFAVTLMAAAAPADAQLMDLLTAPKTLIDRAIEARSVGDIAKDNEIVVKVNAIMAEMGTIKASTEIYEQRLLVTGLFDDKALYDRFQRKVRGVEGVRKLYWHVTWMPEHDPRRARLMGWAAVLELATKAQARLVGTKGVADVNYRVAADPFGVVYLLGRARSTEEMRKTVARARDGDGVRHVANYVDVRP